MTKAVELLRKENGAGYRDSRTFESYPNIINAIEGANGLILTILTR
jgi:hypothetical protein